MIGPIANKDLLKEIDRRIVTLFEVAEVVPKCDCGDSRAKTRASCASGLRQSFCRCDHQFTLRDAIARPRRDPGRMVAQRAGTHLRFANGRPDGRRRDARPNVGGDAAGACREGRLYGGPGNPGRTYDISPDGQRFLMIKDASAGATATPADLIVMEHWVEELKRLVPTK